MDNLSWADFEKVDIRVGTILTVSDFPEAKKPAFQLQVDFGEEIGILKTSAQITVNHDRTDLVGM
ncbi:MAG: tRNA-binding protein, partial [Leeuwenhoekiella sp.]